MESSRATLGALGRQLLAAAAIACLAPPRQAQDLTAGQKAAQLTILQINDVYETMPVSGRGGVARVATLKQTVARAGATPFVVLAGDFLSSSVASTIFKGRQMIDAFNAMDLDLATLGNHEFDFGKEVLLQRMAESKFQYVIANVLDEDTGRPIGGAAPYVVRTFSGLKVGFFGLCLIGEEISRDKRRGMRFLDPLDAAGQAIAGLRRERADTIVAVTHLSYAEDRALATRFPEIGIIVGGHEHFPITAVVGSTLISKAGSDAKFVARIDLHRDDKGLERSHALLPVDGALADDPKTAELVKNYESKLSAEMEVVVGVAKVPLNAEAREVRSHEAAIGNLIADAMRDDVQADLAIINSGSIRGDRIFPAGPLSRRMLITMQPYGNVNCKIEMPGRLVLAALNHGVSKLPAAAGQFPQVSGVTMTLDANRPPDARVRDVQVRGRPLEASAMYTAAVPDYLLNGGDGYTMFEGQHVLTGPESGNLIVTALETYVRSHREVAPPAGERIRLVAR